MQFLCCYFCTVKWSLANKYTVNPKVRHIFTRETFIMHCKVFQHVCLVPLRQQFFSCYDKFWFNFGNQNKIRAIREWELTGLGLILKEAVEAPHIHHSMTRFKRMSSRTASSPANTPSTSPYHESILWGLSKPPWPNHSLWTWDKMTSTWLPCVSPSCSHCLSRSLFVFCCAWMKSRSAPKKLRN